MTQRQRRCSDAADYVASGLLGYSAYIAVELRKRCEIPTICPYLSTVVLSRQ